MRSGLDIYREYKRLMRLVFPDKEREQHRVAAAIWRKNNPEAHRAFSAKYYRENAPRICAERLHLRIINGDEIRADESRRRAKNPKIHRINNARWARNHPEKIRALHAKRRARKRDAAIITEERRG